MNLFGLLSRRATAPVARERLQILLAHERKSAYQADLIAVLHKEVLNAVAKHIPIDPQKVEVSMHRRDMTSVLEIDIAIEPCVVDEKFRQRSALAQQF
ncbi:MAG: cell division topological specificity factor MinE [Methylocystis sp.]